MPELFVTLDKLINQNRIEEAKELQFKINDVIFDLLSFDSLYGAAKQVISVRFDIDCGQPRKPFLPVEKNEEIIKLADKIERYITETENIL